MAKIELDTHDLAEIQEWMEEEGSALSGQMAHILAGRRVYSEWEV